MWPPQGPDAKPHKETSSKAGSMNVLCQPPGSAQTLDSVMNPPPQPLVLPGPLLSLTPRKPTRRLPQQASLPSQSKCRGQSQRVTPNHFPGPLQTSAMPTMLALYAERHPPVLLPKKCW